MGVIQELLIWVGAEKFSITRPIPMRVLMTKIAGLATGRPFILHCAVRDSVTGAFAPIDRLSFGHGLVLNV
jgi:hypothetical protein